MTRKLIMAFAAVAAAFGACAETEETVGGYTWTYRINGDTAAIFNNYSVAISPSPTGTVTIPSTLGGKPVTSIGDYAFYYCSGLTSVTIPDSVTDIGYRAFQYCSSLAAVTMMGDCPTIGTYVFDGVADGCVVYLPLGNETYNVVDGKWEGMNVEYWGGDLTIENGVLTGCSLNGATKAIIPDSVTSIGWEAFRWCRGLTSVTIGNSVTSIEERAFRNCTGLTKVVLPESIKRIDAYAFEGCTSLHAIDIPSIEAWLNISFYEKPSTSPLYEAHNLYINGTLLQNLVIPQGVTSIGCNQFEGCESLLSVTIPDSVTSIGGAAFCGCTNLASVKIGKAVTNIEEAFADCGGLVSFDVDVQNQKYKSQNGLLLSKDGKMLILGVNGEVVVPEGVEKIAGGAFVACKSLTGVIIPDSVTSIGSSAFYGCSSITNVVIGKGLTNISAYMFYGCQSLTSMTIPDSIKTIGTFAFYNCSGLTSVTIPDSVTSIGDYAFYGCSGLTSVTIPASVTSIGNLVFAGCSGLMMIEVNHNNNNYKSVNGLLLSKDGTSLVQGINGSVTIPGSVTSIGHGAFCNCSGLTSVTIPDSVTSIGSGAFYSCRGLSRVTLEGDCPAVAWDAFLYISAKRVVRLPIGNETYNVVDGKWQGMTVEYYDPSDAPTITVGEKGMVEGGEDGGYVVTAKEGETLTAEDFTFIVAPKAAYNIVIADGGKTATVTLNAPQVGVLPGQAEEVQKDEDDKSGLLVEVADSMISEKPEAKAGEVVGALPVKTYPGLWYKVAWGDDLSDLTEGRKVQATGDSLYLGVIKQKGSKGFYRLTVSEQ